MSTFVFALKQSHFMKKVIGLAGSNSDTSINEKLVKTAGNMLEDVTFEMIDLKKLNLPIYAPSLEKEGFPEDIVALKEIFSKADGLIIASPEHNGSMPAFFKNIMDWMSRLEGKIFEAHQPVMVMATSPGARGAATVFEFMKAVMPYWGANIVSSYNLGDFYSHFEGDVMKGEEAEQLRAAVGQFEEALEKVNSPA